MQNVNVVPNWLMQRAYLTPQRIAIKMGEREITFDQLHNQVYQMAGRLHAMGIKRGANIAVLSHNSIEMIEILHALKYIGAVTVLLNTRLTTNELLWQIENAHVDFVLVESSMAKQLEGKSKARVVSFDALYTIEPKKGELHVVKEFSLDKPDTIMYTSGTTGNPKGVIQTYGNHYWSAIGSALNLGIEQEDCWLACVPFFHVSGLSILMRSVIYGMKVVVQDGFQAETVNKEIVNEKVTIISVVSTMLQQMIDHLDERGSGYPPSLRCVLLGGGPAPETLLEKSKLRNIPVFQTYGMTETASQVVTLSSEYSLSKLGSAGKPLFHSQVKIVQNDVEQDNDKPGEILVKGPTVSTGYWNCPDATKSSLKNGWLYTGDIGYLDADGFLYVLDRRKDLIISGGENIYPAEIESVLLSHPEVAEAGVTGKEDLKWGQVPVAFVVLKNPISKEELMAFCGEKLARYKLPKAIYSVTSLPRNATNKLQRHKLLSLLDGTATI
ncbi:o-succinylbenzoate--CoA ligase [Bacillus salitolerans]|uniref:2-succinylbenzoate--CoA ligase n=1 Tax=Bacillus salitolerans TaxID=1437434 RepID=A0ABW4LVR3_9BACI